MPSVAALPSPQHVLDDWDDVGEALARAGARRQNVVLARVRCPHGVGLMVAEPKRLAGAAGLGGLADTEYPAALGMQKTLSHQLVDLAARLECRV